MPSRRQTGCGTLCTHPSMRRICIEPLVGLKVGPLGLPVGAALGAEGAAVAALGLLDGDSEGDEGDAEGLLVGDEDGLVVSSGHI